MLNKVILTLAAAGIMTLSAAGATYKVSLLDDSVVAGKQIKAGDYKVELKDSNTAVLMQGKKSVEVPAKTETNPTKYATTEMQYTNNNQLQEIRIGGTHTKIVFGGATTPASGM
jgi:hypothetical protein